MFTLELTAVRGHIRIFGTCKPCGLGTRKQRGCVMQRRRSVAHTFEDNIAAEKARLEAELPNVPHGPVRDALLKKSDNWKPPPMLTSG